jgi:HEAT repeat protein
MKVRHSVIHALGESKNSETLEILGKIYNNKIENKIIRWYAEEAIRKTIIAARDEFMQLKKLAEEILNGKS